VPGPAGVCLALAGVRNHGITVKSVSCRVTGVRQTAEAVLPDVVGFLLAKALRWQEQSREVGLRVSHLRGQHRMVPGALRARAGINVRDETVTPPCLAAKSQSQTRARWPCFPGGELGGDLCSLA